MKEPTLEKGIKLLNLESQTSPITIKRLLMLLPGKGRSFLLLLLSLPFCIPIQIPGLSTPFGILIAFIGLRMAFGGSIWLPRRLLAKELKKETLRKITNVLIQVDRKTRSWLYPRLLWLDTPPMHSLSGLFICILGILLAIPLPLPFSNLITALPIFLLALATLKDDGLFVLIGYFFAFIAFGYFAALVLSLRWVF